jgi:hypothetical protein
VVLLAGRREFQTVQDDSNGIIHAQTDFLTIMPNRIKSDQSRQRASYITWQANALVTSWRVRATIAAVDMF